MVCNPHFVPHSGLFSKKINTTVIIQQGYQVPPGPSWHSSAKRIYSFVLHNFMLLSLATGLLLASSKSENQVDSDFISEERTCLHFYKNKF